jgi:deoxyadenosine/deoxycytidine kinase
MNRQGRYIAVEGPIGVGKTSLARLLARELDARLVLEEVDDNPFLAGFYEDPDTNALPVQLHFLLARYKQQRELAQQRPLGQTTIADYFFVKDRIFARLNLAPDEFTLYEDVSRLLEAEIAQPDLVVYMSAGSEVLMERLRKRNRESERDISRAYLERVSAAFRDFFFYYDATPLLVIETSAIDFVEDSDDLRDLIREIDRGSMGVQHFVPRKR